jgi:hypothetical protein
MARRSVASPHPQSHDIPSRIQQLVNGACRHTRIDRPPGEDATLPTGAGVALMVLDLAIVTDLNTTAAVFQLPLGT